MSKFGLGRGLSDLKAEMGNVPEISVLAGGERVVVKRLPIEQVGANPDQPRKTFAPEQLKDLAASIKEQGVLQPILVRMVQNRPYQYEIVAGERRWRASKIAGLTDIPAMVKSFSDDNAMEIALIENVQREDLNPIEEATAYQNLMQKCGYEIDDVCRLIGKSESYIRNTIRLQGLPEQVKEMVKAGRISASHARALSVAENAEELAKRIEREKLSVYDTEKIVKSGPRSSKSRSFSANTLPSDVMGVYEKQVSKTINAPVKIKEKKGGAGEIIISFKSRPQMRELIEKLSGKPA